MLSGLFIQYKKVGPCYLTRMILQSQVDKDSATDGPSSSTPAADQSTEVLSDNDGEDDDDDDDDLDVDELNELEASLSKASLQINEPSDTV